jgi:chromosome segregation ATPase
MTKPLIEKNQIPSRSPENLGSSPALYQGSTEQQKFFATNQGSEDIFTLKKKLDEKDHEMAEMFAMFKEIKGSFEGQALTIDNLKTQIETLKANIQMKETQIATVNDTLKMKDAQLKMKEEQVQLKEQQMEAYQKTMETKSKEIDSLRTDPNKVDKKIVDDKVKTIIDLENQLKLSKEQIKVLDSEMQLLKDDLDAADEECEKLNDKVTKMEQNAKNGVFLKRDQVLKRMKEILAESLHNVQLCIPNIEDLAALDIYDIKASVSLKIACDIDMANPKHSEILQEFQALDNVSMRIYDGKDRWTILKDNEAIFFVVVGKDPNQYLAFYTADPLHVKMFNPLAMESWLRGRKV